MTITLTVYQWVDIVNASTEDECEIVNEIEDNCEGESMYNELSLDFAGPELEMVRAMAERAGICIE